jgi:Holliday junction resolvasome RuvABC DNA-binding subunit
MLCRDHNDDAAKRVFGAGYMRARKEQARQAAAIARAEAQEARASAEESTKEVIAGLRSLGCRATEARRVAEQVVPLGHATIEERLRAALRLLAPQSRTLRVEACTT